MAATTWNWKTTGAAALVLTFVPVLGAEEKKFTYLALGDSIAFGVDPTQLPPISTSVPGPEAFTGYPERVAEVRKLLQAKKLANASCPGESSGSFLTFGARDLGCNDVGPQGQPPWKPSIGLRTNYAGTQMEFAQKQLRSHEKIDLVTLSIGGNDLSIVQKDCGLSANGDPAAFAACVQQKLFVETPAGGLAPGEVLQAYAANLTQILTRIRAGAEYKGTLVLLNYYSPSADPLTTGAIFALNQVMAGVGAPFGAKIADGFAAFQMASGPDGDPCRAGLLVELTPRPNLSCDIHPSVKGRNLLAAAVVGAIETKGKRDE
jgi:lysophospholipase L1-like esterase